MTVREVIRESGNVALVVVTAPNTRHTDVIVADCPVNELTDRVLDAVVRYNIVRPMCEGNALYIGLERRV